MDKGIFKKRIIKLKEIMKQHKFDAVIINKFENVTYLSGFTGDDSYLFITQDNNVFITDSRYTEQAAAQAIDYKVIEYKGRLIETLSGLIEQNKVSVMGFEDNHSVYSWYKKLSEGLKTKLAPLEDLVDSLRMVKDQSEIDYLITVARIADEAFDKILGFIKPGLTEAEVAAELEYYIKKLGAQKPSFESIVASGERSSLPHGRATDRVLGKGDAITLDFGASYSGYCSDITRTVFIGEPGDEQKKVYQIVLEAQQKALDGAFSGLTGSEIDSIAREHIKNAGYGEYFGHGLGHGLGLEVHEEPRFSPRYSKVITDGMVVTVEPGIYLPGRFGVRIEDDIVVKGHKPFILTKAPKNLIML